MLQKCKLQGDIRREMNARTEQQSYSPQTIRSIVVRNRGKNSIRMLERCEMRLKFQNPNGMNKQNTKFWNKFKTRKKNVCACLQSENTLERENETDSCGERYTQNYIISNRKRRRRCARTQTLCKWWMFVYFITFHVIYTEFGFSVSVLVCVDATIN